MHRDHMTTRECKKVLNGEVCPGSTYAGLEKDIRENDLVATNIRGKNSDKIVMSTKDGKWKATAVTYNDSPDEMIVFKGD